ncbi:hypothetical protein FQZ97_925160 [compost metagenome]
MRPGPGPSLRGIHAGPANGYARASNGLRALIIAGVRVLARKGARGEARLLVVSEGVSDFWDFLFRSFDLGQGMMPKERQSLPPKARLPSQARRQYDTV